MVIIVIIIYLVNTLCCVVLSDRSGRHPYAESYGADSPNWREPIPEQQLQQSLPTSVVDYAVFLQKG